ncbi:MAG: R2-like ligand-binding oxidase [Thermoflexales bacterium]|nr:R2-like ligand-binding oxidase [Thermoflexales bacterium]MDW8351240.1 R2-like ligand-binding oxidase [Anaerolineae bacterium]
MLDETLLPLSLYHKAKQLVWDPRDIDLSQDVRDWQRMGERERDIILRLSGQFMGGEVAVTHDLAPLLIAIRRQGGLLEEEMFLTTQLFEESKHVEWFDRWHSAMGAPAAAAPSAPYRQLFAVELPAALSRLLRDDSPHAQVEALATYHIIIEGVLAETGYYGYARALRDHGLMPATVRGVELVQRDEARHIAYGLYALDRLLRHEPALWDVLMNRLNALLPLALEVVNETFAPYGDDVPFGLDPSEFIAYAGEQFDHRLGALERGRQRHLQQHP